MPKPIHTEEDYNLGVAEIGRLWDAEPGSQDEADLELWGMALDAYERDQVKPGQLDPVNVLRAEMEMNGRSQADLAALIGGNRASEVLARKRTLTLDMIRTLQKEWAIPADLLVEEYGIVRRATAPRQTPAKRRQSALSAKKMQA